MATEHLEVYKSILNGGKKAIAWGLSGFLPYVIAQSPFEFSLIIDSNTDVVGGRFAGIKIYGPDILSEIDPKDWVIVITADIGRFGKEITDHARSYAPFQIVPPADFDDLADLIREYGLPSRTWPLPWPFETLLATWNDPVAAFAANLNLHETVPRSWPLQPRHACLWIGSLATGGAERQIVYLALGLRRLGWRVTLMTQFAPGPASEQYIARVDAAGVERVELPEPRRIWANMPDPDFSRHFPALALGAGFSRDILHGVAASVVLLEQLRPDLLVGFMDIGSMVAGMSGLLTGVPRIVLCGRSVNPTNFPGLDHFHLDPSRLPELYRCLLARPHVALANNSRAGAASYAEWLGIPVEKVSVAPNAVDLEAIASVSEAAGAQWRERLGIPAQAPVIVGVLRLTEEKGPLLFVEVVARVARQASGLHAILVGDGALRSAVEAMSVELGINDILHILGRQPDVFGLIRAGTIVLQTSRMEGMPNIVLEAQALGRPVVATAVGGTLECLSPELHPFAAPAGDAEALAAGCVQLLTQPEIRDIVAQKACSHVQNEADIITMTQRVLKAIPRGLDIERDAHLS